jgi:AraC-like DNA-binding protein
MDISHVAPRLQAASLNDWNDIVAGEFTGCVVDAAAESFEGRLGACRLGDLGFVKIRAQPSKVRRWACQTPAGGGAALLHLQVAGTGINRQGGCEAVIHGGDGAICDPHQKYGIDFVTPYEMFVLELPTQKIRLRQPGFDIERAAGQAIEPSRSRLLLAFIQAAWDQLDCLGADAEWRDCVSRVSTDLALRAIGQSVDMESAGAEMRVAVIDYIRANMTDPGLRTGAIAKALSVSPRSVQTVFERMSTTASAFILEQRLAQAAARLRAERGRTSITKIAYDCGFSDSAYFSRCFRKIYGVSPRAYFTA